MNRDKIKEILPHREPMLLVDEAELKDSVAIGKYTVRGDEWFLKGHFPGNPVVPGVILCEMMAQSACPLLLQHAGKKSTPYFTGLDKVRFKNSVSPGDVIEFTCTLTAKKGPFYFVQGQGRVGDKLCVAGDFSFAVLSNKESEKSERNGN